MNMNAATIPAEKIDYSQWWYSLSKPWQRAFIQTCFQDFSESTPNVDMLESLFERKVFRFVGPSAPFPNMDFELTDLSGLKQFVNLEILVVTNHQIVEINELSKLNKLTALFLQDNQVKDLSSIGTLHGLEELYVQNNQIESLSPVRQLIKLKRLLCFNNNIENLEGLTEAHAEVLEGFYCLPNEKLSLREVVKTEKELYIACKKC